MCQPSFFPRRERGLFEAREHVLAKYRSENIFQFSGKQSDPYLGIGLALHQIVKNQHLAEDRSGLGGGQRSVVIEVALLAAETAMQAVSQFVSHGHYVAQVVGVVAQNIRMKQGWRGGAEGAAAFALANFRVDP